MKKPGGELDTIPTALKKLQIQAGSHFVYLGKKIEVETFEEQQQIAEG